MTALMEAPTRKATLTKPDGGKVSIPVRQLRVADLIVDTAYQRDLDNVWVQRMLRDGWSESLANVVTVSARGGRLFLLDGQHRIALAREAGIDHVWAYVMTGLTQMQEADLFTQFQRKRRALRIWETFRADSTALKDDALAIQDVVLNSGFRIAEQSGGPGAITAIGALIKIHRLGGTDLLRDTLTVIRRLWTLDDQMALRGQIMHGIAIFLHSFEHEPQFRMDRLEKVLPETAPAKLLRMAQDIASRRSSATVGASNVGEALRDIYNKGMSPEHKLGSLRSANGKRMAS